MIKILKILIFLQLLSLSFLSQANRHEHLTSWPLSSSIIEAFQETYGTSIGNLETTNLLKVFSVNDNGDEKDILHVVLSNMFSEPEMENLKKNLNIPKEVTGRPLKEALYSALKDKPIEYTVEKLTNTKPGTSEFTENLKKLFKFQEDSKKGDFPYLIKELLRQKLFLDIRNGNTVAGVKNSAEKFENFLQGTFTKTAIKIKGNGDHFVGVSVSRTFYNNTLKNLKDALKTSAGLDMDFYLSIPRSSLTSEDTKKSDKFINKTINLVTDSIDEGWGSGIDVTGSISEKDTKLTNKSRANLARNLERLIQPLYDNPGTVFRVHAFEAANNGSFYDELFKFGDDIVSGKIKPSGKPPVLSIGHIATLSDSDIQRFVEIREKAKVNNIPFNIIFDANLVSNENLHDTDEKRIIQVIEKLKKAGFEVGLGSDGSGILGKTSSTSAQVSSLKNNGLDRNIARELESSSKTKPVCDMKDFIDTLQGGTNL